MPDREDGPGDGCEGEVGEGRGRQGRGEAGILHSDFHGESLRAGVVEAEAFAKTKAGGVAKKVVEDDHGKDDKTGREDFLGVVRDDRRNNKTNGDDGDEGQDFSGCLRVLSEESVDEEAEGDGDDDNLHDGEEHAKDIHRDGCPKEQVGDGGREDGGEKGVHAGHADGERDVAFREVGHDVARRPAGAGADEDDAGKEAGFEPEELAQGKCQKRHDGELGQAAEQDIPRAREDKLEVLDAERKAHAEHDDHEERIHPARLHPKRGLRPEQREGRHRKYDDGHEPAKEAADFL